MDYRPHKDLEADAREFLQQRGFHTDELTYHSRLPESIVGLLSTRFSPTALYIRGRADRIAIHRILQIEFEWEAKTHQNPRYMDMTVEALPLAHHLLQAKLDVRCLYIYRNPFTKFECGFWVSELPQFRALYIPNRWNQEQREWFTRVLSVSFPNTRIVQADVKGSGDPYLIVDKAQLAKLRPWKDLIDELLKNGRQQ